MNFIEVTFNSLAYFVESYIIDLYNVLKLYMLQFYIRRSSVNRSYPFSKYVHVLYRELNRNRSKSPAPVSRASKLSNFIEKYNKHIQASSPQHCLYFVITLIT